MIRIIFVVILPLLAPCRVYGIYVWLARRGRSAEAGEARVAPGQEKQPWVWLLLIGVCFSAVALEYVGYQSGVPPGTKLLPPAYVDGEVVPSQPAEQ